MDNDDIKAKGLIRDRGSRFIEDKEAGTREKWDINREMNEEWPSNLSVEETKYYYLSEDYEVYFIEYIGDILSRIRKIPFAHVYLTGRFFAMLFVENGRFNEVIKDVPEIVNIQKGFPYTLSDLKVTNDLYSSNVIDKGNTKLQGEGVVVGIISTGIDYLNPRFLKSDGTSRIVAIWDQNLQEGPYPQSFFFGREFSQQEINEALRRRDLGEDPYEVVKHKDTIGHGTAIAGIIGGRTLELGDPLISVVPKCDFAIVKLKEAKENTLRLSGIDRREIPVYQDSDISASIRYLSELQQKLNKPMVVYLALGSNSGGKNGQTVVERHIDYYSQRRDFSVVCSTGNQGASAGHASGVLYRTGEENIVPLNVDFNEGNLYFSIYNFKSDRISLKLTSPTGETIKAITIPTVNGESLTFSLGQSTITVQYFEELQSIGDERVDVLIRNAPGGPWVIGVSGEYIVKGKYDIWLLQKELLRKETRFLEPDPNITLMTPGTARNILTTAYYNQDNNTVILESGRGFTRDGNIKPSFATSGVNALTVGLNNTPIVVTGAAVGGALLAGAVAMIYEWGVVKKNDSNLYPPKIRSYMISATIKDEGRIYPNEEWGYGRFSFQRLIENLERISIDKKRDPYHKLENLRNFKSVEKHKYMERSNIIYHSEIIFHKGLYIRIPKEIYSTLK